MFVSFQIEQPDTFNDNVNVFLAKNDSASLAVQISKISKERGLDRQSYECAGCRQSLGVTVKPR
jgi:hypothetical protein